MEREIELLFDRLWPLNRSLTGNGVRATLNILSEHIDLNLTEVPSGTKVFDWTIPPEWNINEAYIVRPDGGKIASFRDNNLHILGYSIPVDMKMNYHELLPHIFTLPEQPDVIPYLTSYYKERWGFCMTHNEFLSLPKEGLYHIYIDSNLDSNGSLTYAHAILKGQSKKEIVCSTYVCHPSMANNELSGPLVTTFLYKKLKKQKGRYYTYRFIFTPETIGTIAYLQAYGEYLKETIYGGLVVTCAGDPGNFTYKKSRSTGSEIDKTVTHVLSHYAKDHHRVVDFSPVGSDERQYCSPGFNLPFGSLMRTMYGEYKEYHTSADDKKFISFSALNETIEMYHKVCMAFELNRKYINQNPFGEPFLSRHNLYPDMSASSGEKEEWLRQILYILNFSDGETPLLEIAEKLNVSILELSDNIQRLLQKRLIKY